MDIDDLGCLCTGFESQSEITASLNPRIGQPDASEPLVACTEWLTARALMWARIERDPRGSVFPRFSRNEEPTQPCHQGEREQSEVRNIEAHNRRFGVGLARGFRPRAVATDRAKQDRSD